MQTVEFLFICISKELAIKTLKIARVVLIGRKGFGADVALRGLHFCMTRHRQREDGKNDRRDEDHHKE